MATWAIETEHFPQGEFSLSPVPDISVLDRNSPPPSIPFAEKPGADPVTRWDGPTVVVYVAGYPEPRVNDRYVRRNKPNLLLDRLARCVLEWSRVEPLDQVSKRCAAFQPYTVDGDELSILNQRFDHVVRLVCVPGAVEPAFDVPDALLVGG